MGAGVARQCSPKMFSKQVFPPADGLDLPIVAAEVEQVERTRRSTWSQARSEVSVPLQAPEGCIYSDRQRDQRVFLRGRLSPARNPRTSMEALATPPGVRDTAPSREIADHAIALRSAHDAAMHSTHRRWDMGSVVARQCLGNRCLAPDSPDPPSRPRRRSRSIELEERPGHGLDPRFLCPTGSTFTTRPGPASTSPGKPPRFSGAGGRLAARASGSALPNALAEDSPVTPRALESLRREEFPCRRRCVSPG